MPGMAYDTLPVRQDGFTVDDLAAMADDGRRYELVDGVLLVSPAPAPRHQVAVTELLAILYASCPPDLYVLVAPVDVRAGVRTSLQPDLLVMRRDRLGPGSVAVDPPLLAVEVLSPSSADVDLGLKRRTYARMGVPDYWVVDPWEPALTVFTLIGEEYERSAYAPCSERVSLTRPFPLSLTPEALAGGFDWGYDGSRG